MNMDTFPYNTTTVLLWLLCTTTIMLISSSVTCNTMMTKIQQCNEKDKHSLLNFKQGVQDPSAKLLSSWLPHKDCCHWNGVFCDPTTARVTQLIFPCPTYQPVYGDVINVSYCLTGELDLSLLDLEFLAYLDLRFHDFKAIRVNNNYSSSLIYLDLSYNYDLVIDNLNWTSHFLSLKYLDLSGIDLHRETNWLRPMTMLPSLLYLHLKNCQLRNIYPSLHYANFTSLQVLDLANNDFVSELPSWIFNLSCDISQLVLTGNHIYGQLPEPFPNIRSLQYLHLAINNLDGPIPDSLGQLEQLQELELSFNSFSGQIPSSLGNLSYLTMLDLKSNNLIGNLPESLGKLFYLSSFRVDDNLLTGKISERNFGSLFSLKRLALSSPGLIFDFDSNWVPPFQLIYLSLQYVVPKLPSWLYTQISLKAISIDHSRVSFEPLDRFWKFAAQLVFFSLTNNSIDADMSNVMLNSKFVWLEANNLRGGVPQVSPNVTFLDLSLNSLSGSIAPLLCHKMKEKSKLKYLELGGNNFSGEIPNCWNKNWKSLVHVGLEGNNLTGKIPHSIGSLSNLISLDLNTNKLSGKVPLSLQNCKKLWILDLRQNKFSGAIPIWMGSNVKALLLRSNQFSGTIPAEICQLDSLKILDFANNSLSGPIPNCVHNMSSMISEYASLDHFDIRIYLDQLNTTMIITRSLVLFIKDLKLPYSKSMYAVDLSCNNLSGTMPAELFMLTRLQSLNLSHNQFVGTIPQEIGNLKQLESLDLSSNRFSGQIPQSMSGLSFLGVLNLSFNNLMGEIPLGTQLQSFTNLSYIGNPQLCGPPLTKNCTQGGKLHNTNAVTEDDNDGESEVLSMFYMGLGIGFATGLWGVLGVIFFNKRFRHAYFRFTGKLYDMVLLKMNDVYWKFKNCYTRN